MWMALFRLPPTVRGQKAQKLSPKRALRRLLGALGDWDDLIRSLPRQLGNVLRMFQKQEVMVQLSHRHLEPSVNRLVFGMMVSALFVGSALMWAAKAPPVWNDVSIFGALGCFAAVVEGYRLFRAIQRSGKLEHRDPPD